jgi:hypothetical protein
MAARMQREDWGFISGATAVAETRLLTNDEFFELLRLPSLEALFAHLKQVETYVHLTAPATPDDATRTVEQEYLRIVRRYASETPDARVGDAVLLTRTFGELRGYVREKLFDGETRRRAPVFLTEDALEAIWNDSFSAPPGFAGVAPRVRAGVEKSDDPRRIVDLLLDREELVRLGECARGIGSAWIDSWTREAVRLKTALAVVRARLSGEEPERLVSTLLAPPLDDEWLRELAEEDANRLGDVFAREFPAGPGESASLTRAGVGRLARNIDDRLTALAGEAKCVSYGPERAFGYLWALHIENLNLRLITETFVVEANRDETREKLRASYV